MWMNVHSGMWCPVSYPVCIPRILHPIFPGQAPDAPRLFIIIFFFPKDKALTEDEFLLTHSNIFLSMIFCLAFKLTKIYVKVRHHQLYCTSCRNFFFFFNQNLHFIWIPNVFLFTTYAWSVCDLMVFYNICRALYAL